MISAMNPGMQNSDQPNGGNVSPTFSSHPVHKTLTSVANLANLLPTGMLLSFRTLAPSFSNKGTCQIANQCLTAALIALCSITCFLSTFTDSFKDRDGSLYYGLATPGKLHVFCSSTNSSSSNLDELLLETSGEGVKSRVKLPDLKRLRASRMDMIHGVVSMLVFLAFAVSDNDVQKCFFPLGGQNVDVLLKNLPLAAGVFSSFFFTVFPTTRRGIGYADVSTNNFN